MIYLLLSSHLLPCPPSDMFPAGIQIQILSAFLMSPMHATSPTLIVILNFIIQVKLGEDYKLRSSSLHISLHHSVPCSHLGPNIPLGTLLSNTCSLCFFPNTKD